MLAFTIEKSKTWGVSNNGTTRFFAVVRFADGNKFATGSTDSSVAKAVLSYDINSIYGCGSDAQKCNDAFELFNKEFTSDGVNIYVTTTEDLCGHSAYVINGAVNMQPVRTLRIASYSDKESAFAARKAQIEGRIQRGVYSWVDGKEGK